MKPQIVGLLSLVLLALLCAPSKGSVLSDALSAALTDVVADGTSYSDCYSAFGLSVQPPDVASCALYPQEPSGRLKTILDNRVIRFGVSPFEPSAFLAANSSIIDGSEIRLGKLIAKKLGQHYALGEVKAEFVLVTEQTDFFGKLKAGLDQAKYDAVLSSVTYTLLRASQVDFTCSYFTTFQGLLRGPREPTKNFTVVPAQLNNPSVLVGALGGTVGNAWVDATIPSATKKLYVNETVLVSALKAGELHFAVSDKFILAYGLAVQHPPCPDCTLLPGDYGTGDNYGMFTAKDPAPTPSPTPSPTPKPTPRPPKPVSKDLKPGTIFSLVSIAFFGSIILLGVAAGIYVNFKNN